MFFDKVNNVAALIHAGRAGVFSRICSCALRQMGAAFGTRAQDVYAFVGAGIRKCCYEVKDDVIAALKQVCDDFSKYLYTRNNQHFLDLEAMLKEEFIDAFGITQNALAVAIFVPPNRIHQIVKGQRRITADTDLRLTKYFGLTQGYFLRYQEDYELRIAKRNIADDIAKIVPIKA